MSCHPATKNLFVDLGLQPGEMIWIKGLLLGKTSSCISVEVSMAFLNLYSSADKKLNQVDFVERMD